MNNLSQTKKFGFAALALFLSVTLCAAGYFLSAAGLKIVFPNTNSIGISVTILEIAPIGTDMQQIGLTARSNSDVKELHGDDFNGYYAEVNQRRYSCALSASADNILVCIGPGFSSGSTVSFRLFNQQDQAVFSTDLTILQMGTQPLLKIETNDSNSSLELNVDENTNPNAQIDVHVNTAHNNCLFGLVCLEG